MASPGNQHCANCSGTLSFFTWFANSIMLLVHLATTASIARSGLLLQMS